MMISYKTAFVLVILLASSHALNSTYSVEFIGWFSKGSRVQAVPPSGEKLSAVIRIIASSTLTGEVVASILAEDSNCTTHVLTSQEYNLDLVPGQDVMIILDLVINPSLLASSVAIFMRLEGAAVWEMPSTYPPRLWLQTLTAIVCTTQTFPYNPPKCIIATTAFGSEVSPAVQFLRDFRDRLVLSTKAGSAFMTVFNAWYYSFSPPVAEFIAYNDLLRAAVRIILYPLLGVLDISTLAYSIFSYSPEFAVSVAGLVASSMVGLVYLITPTLIVVKTIVKRRRIRIATVAKYSFILLAVALAILAIGEITESFSLLAIGSTACVLDCTIMVPTITVLTFAHKGRRRQSPKNS